MGICGTKVVGACDGGLLGFESDELDGIPEGILSIILGMVGIYDGIIRLVCRRWNKCMVLQESLKVPPVVELDGCRRGCGSGYGYGEEWDGRGILVGRVKRVVVKECQIGWKMGWLEKMVGLRELSLRGCLQMWLCEMMG